MRRRFNPLVLLLVFSLALWGCKRETRKDSDYFHEVMTKMTNIESYSLRYVMVMNMTMGGEDMAMKLVSDGDYYCPNTLNCVGHITMVTDTFGEEESREMYIKNQDDYVYSYVDVDDRWIYSKLKQTLSNAPNFSKVRKEKSDKDGYNKYRVTISYNDLKPFLGGMGNELQTLLGNISVNEDINMTLYLTDESIAMFEIDLSDMINTLYKDNGLSDLKVNVTLTGVYDNLNKIDPITIPSNVIKGAEEVSIDD